MIEPRYLIVNADDFGYSYSINKGIIKAHTDGIVTSTSVMVDAIAADEAKDLVQYEAMSIGLHFVFNEGASVESELERQIEKFVMIVGRQPDHIDPHKSSSISIDVNAILAEYSTATGIPARKAGQAKYIGSFGIKSDDASVGQLKKSIDEATDRYSELMCHVGYADDYLRSHSSYSQPREEELASICDPSIKQYLSDSNIEPVSWRQYKLNATSFDEKGL